MAEDKYLKDSEGNYILNKDGSKRKKSGRPKTSELSDTRIALQAQRRLKTKDDNVKKLRRSLKIAESKLNKEKKALTSNVLTEADTKELPDAIQEHLNETGSYVAFMPNEGPQTDYMAAPE